MLGSKWVGDCRNGDAPDSNAGEQKLMNCNGTLQLEDEIWNGIPDWTRYTPLNVQPPNTALNGPLWLNQGLPCPSGNS